MKIILYLLAVMAVAGCGRKEADGIKMKTRTEAGAEPENPLNKLSYANKIDFYCKMDLKYGVSDTVTYKENLYGFCSPVCKQEFLKKPDEYLEKMKH
jgi:YHS domain-containing protein